MDLNKELKNRLREHRRLQKMGQDIDSRLEQREAEAEAYRKVLLNPHAIETNNDDDITGI
jgi:hypothetical protein